jgi:tRNA uridine 5-carboxymethylaminomethyl modification enzyme
MRSVIEAHPNIFIKQGVVKRLLINSEKVLGVELQNGYKFYSESVVVTTGTFLHAICHVGLTSSTGGRMGEISAVDLSSSLCVDAGLEIMRLKTGTVPRLDSKTICYDGLEEQLGDSPLPLFSFSKTTRDKNRFLAFSLTRMKKPMKSSEVI